MFLSLVIRNKIFSMTKNINRMVKYFYNAVSYFKSSVFDINTRNIQIQIIIDLIGTYIFLGKTNSGIRCTHSVLVTFSLEENFLFFYKPSFKVHKTGDSKASRLKLLVNGGKKSV